MVNVRESRNTDFSGLVVYAGLGLAIILFWAGVGLIVRMILG